MSDSPLAPEISSRETESFALRRDLARVESTIRRETEMRLTALEALIGQRFEAGKEAITIALTAERAAVAKALAAVGEHNKIHAEAHAREHADQQLAEDRAASAAMKAIDKAEASLFARLDVTNQWREQFNAQAAHFVTRETVEAHVVQLHKDLQALRDLAATLQTREASHTSLEVANKERDTLRQALAMMATREMLEAHVSACALDRASMREAISKLVPRETYDERYAILTERVQKSVETQAVVAGQIRVWAFVLALVVVAINVLLRFV